MPQLQQLQIKQSSWNKLGKKIAQCNDPKKKIQKEIKIHCHIPMCLGFVKKAKVASLKEDTPEFQAIMSTDLEEKAREFHAILIDVLEKGYEFTTYLSPKDKDLSLTEEFKKTLSKISPNPQLAEEILKNVSTVQEWRETETYKKADNKYKELFATLEKLSVLQSDKLSEADLQLIQDWKPHYDVRHEKDLPADRRSANENQNIIELAKIINEKLNDMIELDIRKCQTRGNFKGVDPAKIKEHILTETAEYISWKKPLDKPELINQAIDINVVIYSHELFKSMEIMDNYADLIGYSKDSPVKIKPEFDIVEDLGSEQKLNIGNKEMPELNRGVKEMPALEELKKKKREFYVDVSSAVILKLIEAKDAEGIEFVMQTFGGLLAENPRMENFNISSAKAALFYPSRNLNCNSNVNSNPNVYSPGMFSKNNAAFKRAGSITGRNTSGLEPVLLSTSPPASEPQTQRPRLGSIA